MSKKMASRRSRRETPSGGQERRSDARLAARPMNQAAELVRGLDHPLKADIERVRAIILGVSPTISDGIKWNSVSFRTTEWFATLNLRSRDAVQFVFHLGAKVKDNTKALKIADPAGLMKWLAKDRCLVTLGAGKDIEKNRKAFETIVREWIMHL